MKLIGIFLFIVTILAVIIAIPPYMEQLRLFLVVLMLIFFANIGIYAVRNYGS